jgi:hypothetical protein
MEALERAFSFTQVQYIGLVLCATLFCGVDEYTSNVEVWKFGEDVVERDHFMFAVALGSDVAQVRGF